MLSGEVVSYRSGLVMQLDELFENWGKDCNIDRAELGNESTKIPQLHFKYFKFLSNERLLLKKLESEYTVLHKCKWDYYQGIMTLEDLQEKGWEQQPLKILKTDLPQYIGSDGDIIKMNQKIAYQKEKIEFLESVIRTINNRGFQIKNAIDWEKFKVGI